MLSPSTVRVVRILSFRAISSENVSRRLKSDAESIKYLRTLELDVEHCTQDLVRRQYISLVKKYHPDAFQGSREKFEQIDEVGGAYPLLRVCTAHVLKSSGQCCKKTLTTKRWAWCTSMSLPLQAKALNLYFSIWPPLLATIFSTRPLKLTKAFSRGGTVHILSALVL